MVSRNRKVIATVISQRGTCEVGHQVGDKVSFTEDQVQGMICIHCLYSMIAKVYAIYYGATFPWLQNGQKATHACPDPNNPVVFELEVVEES